MPHPRQAFRSCARCPPPRRDGCSRVRGARQAGCGFARRPSPRSWSPPRAECRVRRDILQYRAAAFSKVGGRCCRAAPGSRRARAAPCRAPCGRGWSPRYHSSCAPWRYDPRPVPLRCVPERHSASPAPQSQGFVRSPRHTPGRRPGQGKTECSIPRRALRRTRRPARSPRRGCRGRSGRRAPSHRRDAARDRADTPSPPRRTRRTAPCIPPGAERGRAPAHSLCQRSASRNVVYSPCHWRLSLPVSPWRFLSTISSVRFGFSISWL